AWLVLPLHALLTQHARPGHAQRLSAVRGQPWGGRSRFGTACALVRAGAFSQGEMTMLRLALVFLVIALIAGLFGFVGVASLSWEGAKILFFIFLVLAVLSALGGRRRWRRWD